MASNKPSVFIDGEAGTTGLGIRARLEALPQVALQSLPSALRKDKSPRSDMLADGLGLDAPMLLDASTAHRVDPQWTYGFPEMAQGQAGRIGAARKVTNP